MVSFMTMRDPVIRLDEEERQEITVKGEVQHR